MVNHAALSSAIDDFAGTVTGDFSAEDILTRLADSAIKVLALAGAGIMAAEDGELLRFVSATSPPVSVVEELQSLQQAGPCHDAFVTQQIVNVTDLADVGPWPQFRSRACELGLRSVAAVPLVARQRVWGVLDVYRSAPDPLCDLELEALQTLANIATSYLVVTADRDIAREAQEQLAYRAMHDTLTGLPLRWVLIEQLTNALAHLERTPANVGVLFLDLDGLKYVNDTYGHSAGDSYIMACAHRIQAAVRPSDVVARVGGDEFAVLLDLISDPADAAGVAQRILDELAVPYQVDGLTMQPSASIGVALSDSARQTAHALIAHADAAMYRAKHGGRGRFEVFDAELYETQRDTDTDDRVFTAELRLALQENQLELHYQPILDLRVASEAPYAVEALVRWRHPRRGLLPAESFISAAERMGMVTELSTWVLHTACQQLVQWDRQFGAGAPERVFVNLSAADVTQRDLVRRVTSALRESGLEPQRLTLEITETGLMPSPGATASLPALRELGCQVAIDDFGTGYSSLSRLVTLPATMLKVDQSFTRGLRGSTDAFAVMSAVLSLGESLHRTVVVEGVEDADTLESLRDMGCTHAQGFYLARPQAPEQLEATWRTAQEAVQQAASY